MENNLSLGMTSNVQIKLFDKKSKRLLQVKNIHNKANKSMVDGLLGFLQGNFTGSVINQDTSDYKARDSWRYIPCYVYAGDGGVTVNNHQYGGCTVMSAPGFHDTSLARRLSTPAKIDKCFEADYVDLEEQDSAAIFLEAQFGEYDLVRNPDNPDEYLDRTYKVARNWTPYTVGSVPTEKTGSLITEVALYSNKVENNGRMLARVVFDQLNCLDESGYPTEEIRETVYLSGDGETLNYSIGKSVSELLSVVVDDRILGQEEYTLSGDNESIHFTVAPSEGEDNIVISYKTTEGIDKNRTPVFKTDDEFMVITWRIAIISIGVNDNVSPSNN